MTRYLDDQANVDAINAQLRDICPTLFSADDATYSKVTYFTFIFIPLHRQKLIPAPDLVRMA